MHAHHHDGSSADLLGAFLPLFLIVCLAVAYGLAVWKQQAKKPWSNWRMLSFSLGILLLLTAMWPSMMRYAHQDIRGHMVQHLLIGMLAPIGLTLGAPMTLALTVLPRKAARVVTAFLSSTFFHCIAHPITAFMLNIGGMAVLYLTPLYTTSLTTPVLHHFIHLHFLLAGYMFTWSMIGPDPAPQRPTLSYRAVVLFISMAAHATLSKYLYAYEWPRNTPYTREQIWSAAKIMYYGGDFSELLLTVILFTLWYQKKGRKAYKMPLLEAR